MDTFSIRPWEITDTPIVSQRRVKLSSEPRLIGPRAASCTVDALSMPDSAEGGSVVEAERDDKGVVHAIVFKCQCGESIRVVCQYD